MKSTNPKIYTAYTFLGTGVIVIHDGATADKFAKAGYKIHRKFGKMFGIALFTFQL